MICFRPFHALIKCNILGNSTTHAFFMDVVKGLHCCSNRPVENDKRPICRWIKTNLKYKDAGGNVATIQD